MLAREVKRQKLCKRYSEKRALLKKRVIDPDLSMEERLDAVMDLQKLPRDSNPNRQRNRCALTGRPRGYYRRFGLGRNKLREVIMKGEAPGATKASW